MKTNKSDSGRSLLEALLYISLVGVMVVASVKMYSDYNQKIKRTKAQDQLEEISSKVNSIYFGKKMPAPGTPLNQKLIENSVNLKDPWGKDINVISNHAEKKEYNYYISMSLDKTNCIYLAMNVISKVAEPTINNIVEGEKDPLVNCNQDVNTVNFHYTTK